MQLWHTECKAKLHYLMLYIVSQYFSSAFSYVSYLQDSDPFWPGLGGTETDYARVLIAYSIFETALIPVAVLMLGTLPYTTSLLLTMLLYAVGGAVYACAVEVWMVMLARGLTGSAALFCSSSLQTYVGEMGTIMDKIRERKGKQPMKHVLYIMIMFATNGAMASLFGELYM